MPGRRCYTVYRIKRKVVIRMTRTSYTISLPYSFDPAHKGAPYTFDGVHYMNNGEFIETLVKYHMGFAYGKDANTPYDMGSDIPEIRASVKSGKATLVNKKLGADMAEFLDNYFANVHSDKWAWGVQTEENLTVYMMNATEFRAFTEMWANMNERGVVRYKATSGKMVRWLEERVG